MGTNRSKWLRLIVWSVVATIPFCQQALPVQAPSRAAPGVAGRGVDLTPDEVEKIIDRLFRGYLKARDCAQHPARQGYALSPHYVTADFNRDGSPDLAVAVWQCVENSQEVQAPLPFRLLALNMVNPTRIPPEIRDLRYLVSAKRLLVILHGQVGRGFEDTPVQSRFALAATIGGAAVHLGVFRGRLRPAKMGDEPRPERPPRREVTAAVTSDPDGKGMAAYWNGVNYSDYPWYACLYPKTKTPPQGSER